jgi:hypothetical protein
VPRENKRVTVVLSGGDAAMIQPAQTLSALPELEGSLPDGWKDAIY